MLFSLDAVAMYTNIDIEHDLKIIQEWQDDQTVQTSNIPKNFILESLKLCMKENYFYFGDLRFLQTNGTAIGTPCAVVYANLYAGRSEKNNNFE